MDATAFRHSLSELGLSQADLARLLEVTPRAVNLWATGQRDLPGPVRAYLDLFRMAPPFVREATLARIGTGPVKEGFYSLHFKGSHESGVAVIILDDGRLYGTDDSGTRFDGTYYLESKSGEIQVETTVTMLPGVEMVQGIPAQDWEWSFTTLFHFPRRTGRTELAITSPFGPIEAVVRFLRNLP